MLLLQRYRKTHAVSTRTDSAVRRRETLSRGGGRRAGGMRFRAAKRGRRFTRRARTKREFNNAEPRSSRVPGEKRFLGKKKTQNFIPEKQVYRHYTRATYL